MSITVADGNFDPNQLLENLPNLGQYEAGSLPEGLLRALLLSYQRNQELTVRVNNIMHAFSALELKVANQEESIRKMKDQEISDFDEVIALRSRMNDYDNREETTIIPDPSKPRKKVADPEEFTGDRRKFLLFKSQLISALGQQLSTYPTETDKFNFAVGFIRGDAYQHVMPWVDSQRDNPAKEVTNFETFISSLEKAFGPIDEKGDAQRRLSTIKQTGSVDAYAALFRSVMYLTGYNDESLKRAFMEGLKQPILDKMVGLKPEQEGFEGFVQFASKIEHDLAWYKKSTSTSTSSNTTSTSKPTFTPRKDPNAMDVDKMKLEREKFLKLRAEGKCFNCEQTGHMSSKCPKPRKEKTRVAVATTPEPSATIEEVDERALVPVTKKSLDERNAESLESLTATLKDFMVSFSKQNKGF